MSAQALGYTYFRLSAQAFRTKHTHFPLYVGAGSGVYILSLVGTSFQNEAYTLSFVIGAGSGVYILSLVVTGF